MTETIWAMNQATWKAAVAIKAIFIARETPKMRCKSARIENFKDVEENAKRTWVTQNP